MSGVRNILFIMCDQLRADYLGCTGHPNIKTPVIDGLARDGVLFDHAFCNAPVCGPSRASFYTGRYPISHGANYNNYPLRVDEWTMGDYLKPLGVRTVLVGKTHMRADIAGMKRLGIDPATDIGLHISQTGFEPWERDDGLHPQQNFDPDLPYNRFLRAQGYISDNPWHDFANSAVDDEGNPHSGWYLRNADRPARVREEHSETPYMTDRAIRFIQESGNSPWCMHLSYIKPHWPYIAPSPYHAMYGKEDVLPANKIHCELDNPNPVYAAFLKHDESKAFARDECRDRVIPTYMGLISQIDHHLARLFDVLKAEGRWNDTLIVFTSDHGDYLGDHWLGEKELFHEASLRIPMIIRDPSSAADATRGSVSKHLVESIDLIPTFLDLLGGDFPQTRLEGRSLKSFLHGTSGDLKWRDCVFSEFDFSLRSARRTLGLEPHEARGFMVRNDQWKFVYFPKHAPQLFDLINDPDERYDLGVDVACADIRHMMQDHLIKWFSLRRNRTTYSDERITENTGMANQRGYLFGVW